MNIILIITAIFIVTETIDPNVDKEKDIRKKEVVAETVETKPAEEINSEAQAAEQAAEQAAAEDEAQAQAQAAAEAEAQAQAQAAAEAEEAEKEINYLKIALYIILTLAILSGALLYFRKQDKPSLESKIIPPGKKEEQLIQEETQPETKEEQPIDNANKEPTNFEETNEDEKK